MTVVGVGMFHNEADVAPYVVRHMLDECDSVVVADHNSTDSSHALLVALREPRLTIVEDHSTGYQQAASMTRLIGMVEADWIVPFDFDEWWYSDEGRLADVLMAFVGSQTAALTIDMIPQPSDCPGNPFERIVHTRPGSFYADYDFRKVAFRPGPPIMQGNHGLLGQERPPIGPLRIRHYPFRNFAQAAAKLRYGGKVVARASPPGTGQHWIKWGAYSDAELQAWWTEWTDPKGLVLA